VDDLVAPMLKGYTDLYKGNSNGKLQTRLRKTKRVHGHCRSEQLPRQVLRASTCFTKHPRHSKNREACDFKHFSTTQLAGSGTKEKTAVLRVVRAWMNGPRRDLRRECVRTQDLSPMNGIHITWADLCSYRVVTTAAMGHQYHSWNWLFVLYE
jgi:hypothetical protein